jgi:hypothetical protein
MFYGGRKEAFSAVGMRRMGAANPAWLHPNDASTLLFLEKWQGGPSRFVSRFPRCIPGKKLTPPGPRGFPAEVHTDDTFLGLPSNLNF